MTIQVCKIEGEIAVVLPLSVAREMELVEGTQLEIDASAEGIVLRKPRRRVRRPIGEIV